MRPVVKPGLRRLWRDATTLQIGIDPERALVLGGLAPAVAEVLELLDGPGRAPRCSSRRPATRSSSSRSSTPGGALDDAAQDTSVLASLPAADRERLAPDLTSLSLLGSTPGAALLRLARRQASRVQVRGAGRVGSQVAALLAAAGVGSLSVDDDTRVRPADVSPGGLRLDDVGRPRAAATCAAVARVTRPRAGRGRRPGEPFRPDLVVLAPPTVPLVDLDEPAELERRRIPHLLVGVRETTGVVGPLVLPGRSACLGCHHPACPCAAAAAERAAAVG